MHLCMISRNTLHQLFQEIVTWVAINKDVGGVWKRFIRSLLGVDRCSLSWASGRGLLEVYWGWTDAASAGDQEEVY